MEPLPVAQSNVGVISGAVVAVVAVIVIVVIVIIIILVL